MKIYVYKDQTFSCKNKLLFRCLKWDASKKEIKRTQFETVALLHIWISKNSHFLWIFTFFVSILMRFHNFCFSSSTAGGPPLLFKKHKILTQTKDMHAMYTTLRWLGTILKFTACAGNQNIQLVWNRKKISVRWFYSVLHRTLQVVLFVHKA